MTVSEAQERIDSAEYAEWCWYLGRNPGVGVRVDYGFAMLASIVANMAAPKGKRYAPRDFLPKWGQPPPTREQVQRKIQLGAMRLIAMARQRGDLKVVRKGAGGDEHR